MRTLQSNFSSARVLENLLLSLRGIWTDDICYCLDNYPGGLEQLAAAWKHRGDEEDVKRAIKILQEKFASVDDFGPKQVVEFFDSPNQETQAMQARRAFELVQKLLALIPKA